MKQKLTYRYCNTPECNNHLEKGQHYCDSCKEEKRIRDLQKQKEYRNLTQQDKDMIEKRETIRKMILNFTPEVLNEAYESVLNFNRMNVKLLQQKIIE